MALLKLSNNFENNAERKPMRNALIVLVALIIGIVLGAQVGGDVPLLRKIADVIGTLWLNGLRMTVVPLVVSLLIVGLLQTAAAAKAGRLAARSVLTMIALLWISSIIAAIMIPSLTSIMPMPEDAARALKLALGNTPLQEIPEPFEETLKKLIPANPFKSAVETDILPLIIFTMAFAFAAIRLPENKRHSILSLFDGVAEALVTVVGWVLILAPIGVFALAYKLGVDAGTASFSGFVHYVIILTLTGSVIWLLSFAVAYFGGGKNVFAFFKASIPAQAVAISTQSSLAAMPAMLKGVEQLGVRTKNSEVTLPIAVALFRATGPAMNLGVALYVAHWLGIELSAGQIALGIAVGAITTMGAVSLPGSISFISSIAPICLAMGVPIEPLGLLVAIETFPDIMRTLGNVTMDMAVTATVDHRMTDEPLKQETAS
jgi:proton glutamate symport protein